MIILLGYFMVSVVFSFYSRYCNFCGYLLLVFRRTDIHPKTRKILHLLKLRRIFSGVFIKANEGVIRMLQRVEPYITYGYENKS